MRWISAAAGVILVLGMPSSPLADAAESHDPRHDCGEAQVRPHGCEYSFTLAPEEYVAIFGKKEDGTLAYRVPRLKLFDTAGLQILDLAGYSHDHVKALERAIESPEPVNGGRTLTDELSRVRTKAGHPPLTSDLSDAGFFIVTYGAEWCVPCKAQLKDVRRFADANRKGRINLVHVEANVMDLVPETQKQLLGFTLQAPKHGEKER